LSNEVEGSSSRNDRAGIRKEQNRGEVKEGEKRGMPLTPEASYEELASAASPEEGTRKHDGEKREGGPL